MLHFNRLDARHGVTLILSAILVANCNYDPPSVDPGSGGGGAGGNDASSSSTTSSSTTSSSTTSSSTTSSSSSGAGAEDCVNNVDDDGNGKSDCADPICSPMYKCVPNGPADAKWSTPFHAKYMAFDAQAAPCATNKPATVYGVGPSPDGCTGCDCQISGGKCSGTELTCYDSMNCGPGNAPPVVINGSACTSVNGLVHRSCAVTKGPAFEAGNAQCTATGGMRVAAHEFAQKLVRCDAPTNTGAGCLTGQSCAVAPTADYDWQCIAAAGNQPCPPDYTIQLTGYDAFSDSRVCSPCTCDLGSAACAANNVFRNHTDMACQSPPTGSIPPSGCKLIQGTTTISYKEQGPFVLAKGCNSTQDGNLDKGPETTICCRTAIP